MANDSWALGSLLWIPLWYGAMRRYGGGEPPGAFGSPPFLSLTLRWVIFPLLACSQEIASGASFFSTRRCGVARSGGKFYQEWISHSHSTFRGRFLLRLGGVVVVLELPGGSERPVKNEHCVDRPFPRSCPIPRATSTWVNSRPRLHPGPSHPR